MIDIKKTNITDAKIGFGTYKILDQQKMNDAIKWAIDSGYDFIDTAKLYRTEELIANALKKYKDENPDKHIPMLQSKIWPSDFKNGVKKEMLECFKRLGNIKKIDAFLLHRPHVDNTINVKAWKELIECKKEGLVDKIGLSNFEPDMIRILYHDTNVLPDFIHIEASVTYLREDRIKHAKDSNLPMQG
ncbi:MAG: aldo/keto reductase [Bacilli bacterium]